MSLGFREHGLNATQAQRDRMTEILQLATTFQATSSRLSIRASRRPSAVSKSKVVVKRNLAWHKAELADVLYQTKFTAEGEDDESTEDPEEGDLSRVPTDEQDDGVYGQAGSSSVTKS